MDLVPEFSVNSFSKNASMIVLLDLLTWNCLMFGYFAARVTLVMTIKLAVLRV